jgi:hypothetical protein
MAFILVVATALVAACGHKGKEQSAAGNVALPTDTQPSVVPNTPYRRPPTASVDTTKAKHHSKLGGAAVGAAAGHMAGHAATGAAVGAIVQHERNKHKK